MRLLLIVGLLGVVTSAAFCELSPTVIRHVYPQDFWAAIKILQILSLSILAIFIGQVITHALVAQEMSSIYLFIALSATTLNILLNYFLIPATGGIGAAWATVTTEMLVAVLSIYFLWRRNGPLLTTCKKPPVTKKAPQKELPT